MILQFNSLITNWKSLRSRSCTYTVSRLKVDIIRRVSKHCNIQKPVQPSDYTFKIIFEALQHKTMICTQ